MCDYHNKKLYYSDLIKNNSFPKRNEFIDKELQKDILDDINNKKPLHFLTNDVSDTGYNDYSLRMSGILVSGAKAIINIINIKPYVDVYFKLETNKERHRLAKEILSSLDINATIRFVKGKKLFSFQKEDSVFTRITFNNLNDRKKFIIRIRDVYETFNDETSSYHRSVAREYKFNLSSWNLISDYSIASNSMIKNGIININVDVRSVKGLTSIEDDVLINNTLYSKTLFRQDNSMLVCYDIESYSPVFGRVPLGDRVDDVVFMIGMTFHFTNKVDSILNLCIVSKESDSHDEFCTIVCKNEAEVIKCFAYILSYMIPDFITEYNGSQYDWRFIYHKLDQYNLHVFFRETVSMYKLSRSELSLEKIKKYIWNYESIKIDAETNISSFNYKTFGMLPYDTKIIFHKLFPKVGKYSLNFMLKHNKLPTKIDMPIHELFRIYASGTSEEMKEVAYYCFIDCVSLQRLLLKQNVIQDKREVASISYTSLFDSFYRADGLRVKNLIVSTCIENNIFASTYFEYKEKGETNDETKKYKYSGAMVLEPKKGIVNSSMNIKEFLDYSKINYINIDVYYLIIDKLYEYIYRKYNCTIINHSFKKLLCLTIISDNESYDIDVDIAESDKYDFFEIIDNLNKYNEYIRSNRIKYPITALDFASLYPSLIMTYNISPEFLVETEEEAEKLKEEGYDVMKIDFNMNESNERIEAWLIRGFKDSYYFGLYPSILHKLFSNRKDIKKIVDKYEHRKEELEKLEQYGDEYDDVCYNFNYYNSKQKGIKVYMNTYYGEMGNTNSPLFKVPLAGGVTSNGRRALFLVKNYIEKKYNADVYYGDTDSLYFSCCEKNFLTYDYQYYTNKITKLEYSTNLVNITFEQTKIINADVNELLYKDNGQKYLNMSYEEVLFPAAFLSKKKYYGIPHKKIVNFKPKKLFIKGLEIIKVNVSNILVETITTLLNESMDLNNVLTLRELIYKHIDCMFNTTWNPNDFIKSAKWNPTKDNKMVGTYIRRLKERGLPLPHHGERFDYIMVKKFPYTYNIKGNQTALSTGDKMEPLELVLKENLPVDLEYYFNGEVCGQMARILSYDEEFAVYVDGELDVKRSYDNCKKHIKSYSAQYNNKYSNKGKIFKNLYRIVNNNINSYYKCPKDFLYTSKFKPQDLNDYDKLVKSIDSHISKKNIRFQKLKQLLLRELRYEIFV